MSKGLGCISLLLLAVSAHAAVDDQIIEREAASAITLAGRIGEAALYSVQADGDDDLEIFATASSNINSANDHWILLDWDGTDYKIMNSGNLQSSDNNYLSSYQVSHNELLLGQAEGQLTTITFTNNAEADEHIITEEQTLLSSLTHEDIADVNFDGDIQAIVNIKGVDQNNYTVLCTEELIHILGDDELISTLQDGGYCQTGNIDYDEVIDNPGVYDQELVLASGLYYTFDGSDWLAKTNLSSDVFGDNFLIANIDDDAAAEILSQGRTDQVQSFSPAGIGSWVFISGLQDATGNFYVTDSNADENMEIIFDYVYTEEEPHAAIIKRVSWDTDNDSHITDTSHTSPYLNALTIKRLATTLTDGVEGNFSLFTSNAEVISPTANLFTRLDESDLSTDWSGIYSSHARSFDVLVRTTDGDSLDNHGLVQIEQISLGDNIYEYAYKFLSAIDLSFSSIIEPNFDDNEIVSVNSLTSFDLDDDGIDELHAGGAAVYDDTAGIVMSSYLDGTDYGFISTPTLASVSALYIGDINLESSADIVATGEDISDGGAGIGVHFYYDNTTSNTTWFSPGSGDTEFKTLIASNIKGDDKPEILGLHSQLASYNANAEANESSFYNLSNLDLNNFTPITLENRDYQYALATDSAGMLHLIEPKDFDILATSFACSSELTAVYSVRISNNIDVAFGVCEQSLMSWVVEYDEDIQDYGYNLYELASTDLGNADTSSAQLMALVTDPEDTDNTSTHLFTLFANKFQRFELNIGLGDDTDTDGYLNYRDAFPEEVSQWEDSDRDTLGDNQDGNDPDPSLNDIDNDGVTDDNDPDNDPENDFNFDNDIDHGLPSFIEESLATTTLETSGDLTLVSVTAPQASDAYDAFTSNTTPTITGSVNGEALTENDEGQYQISLVSGAHTIAWQATDIALNSSTIDQNVWVYPSIAFQSATQEVGETQTAQITINLSGTSPEYPLEVTLELGGTIEGADVLGGINDPLTVTFNDGETQAVVEFEFIDDNSREDSEILQLTILDTFDSAEGSESWTINSENNIHTINVANLNHAPEVSYLIEQDGSETQTPTNIAGTITLSSTVIDSDTANTHTYIWDISSLGLENQTSQNVEVDPSVVTPGDYDISLTVTDNGLPILSTEENFTLTIAFGDSDGDGVLDNEDAYPNEVTQWADSDHDNLGDNPNGVNPDPSLNDIDNDGVTDDTDSQNNGDSGAPVFRNETLDTITSESTSDLTTVIFANPEVSDLYDDFYGNDTAALSASIDSVALSANGSGQMEASLAPGAYTIEWQASDVAGNTAVLTQDIWVYPSIAFELSGQALGESQTAQVSLSLNGASPEYPLIVNIELSGGDITNNDVNENISQNLIVTFANGETEASIQLEFIDDDSQENTEFLELSIIDTFNSEAGNESWTIDENNNTHVISVADFNEEPEISYTQEQNELVTDSPTNIGGSITLTALVSDNNESDTHSYNWDLSSLDINNQTERVAQIDPSNITPGDYDISLVVTDNGLPNLSTEESFTLTIAYGDTDGDGVLDNEDAFPTDPEERSDSDGDGLGDEAENREVDASGSLYFYLLLLFPLLYRRR
ncbi:MAG: Calx-beta domain-containing protein [Bermanella sp.]